MNAGSSQVGQDFALRNCDAFFVATSGSRTSIEGNAKKVDEIKYAAQAFGRDIEVYTVGQVICRASRLGCDRRHARKQEHHAADDTTRGIRQETSVLCGECDRRLSVRGNAGPRGGRARQRQQSRHARHRPLVRQLSRRAAVFPRRSASALGAAWGADGELSWLPLLYARPSRSAARALAIAPSAWRGSAAPTWWAAPLPAAVSPVGR